MSRITDATAPNNGGGAALTCRTVALALFVTVAATSSQSASVAALMAPRPLAATPACFAAAPPPVAASQRRFKRRHCSASSSSSALDFRSRGRLGGGDAEEPIREKGRSRRRFWRRRGGGKSARESGSSASTIATSAVAGVALDPAEHERRKREWAAKYTDVSTLRHTFGTNRNKLWGDFDPETTRRLYHTLLPRALMALKDLGIMTEKELAPLAYEARNAAKKYARERSMVPGRVFSMCYDGYRSWRSYGKWNPEGMTWEQVWEKYEQQIVDELSDDHDDEELTRQICLRILERSCKTNPTVDKIFLGEDQEHEKKAHALDTGSTDVGTSIKRKDAMKRQRSMDIASISAQLESDIRELLTNGDQNSQLFEPTKTMERKQRKEKRRRRRREEETKSMNQTEGKDLDLSLVNSIRPMIAERRRLTAKDVARLRMMAEAKRAFAGIKKAEKILQASVPDRATSLPLRELQSSSRKKIWHERGAKVQHWE